MTTTTTKRALVRMDIICRTCGIDVTLYRHADTPFASLISDARTEHDAATSCPTFSPRVKLPK